MKETFESDVLPMAEWDDFFSYNPASRHRRRVIYHLIDKYKIKFKSVFDVGCGDGRLLEEMLSRYKTTLYGLEIGPSTAPQRLGEKLKGFYKLDIQKEGVGRSFELIVCTEVIEHLKYPELAVKNLGKMSNGYIIITVPGGKLEKTDEMIGHLRHYTPETLTALMDLGGFEKVRCFSWGFPFHSLYKTLINLRSEGVFESFGKARYSFLQRTLCNLIHILFYFNSWRHGIQLFYLGKKRAS